MKDMYGENATTAHALAEGERKHKEMRAKSPNVGRNHAGVHAKSEPQAGDWLKQAQSDIDHEDDRSNGTPGGRKEARSRSGGGVDVGEVEKRIQKKLDKHMKDIDEKLEAILVSQSACGCEVCGCAWGGGGGMGKGGDVCKCQMCMRMRVCVWGGWAVGWVRAGRSLSRRRSPDKSLSASSRR